MHCCYLFLGSQTKIKKKYLEEIQKIIGVKKECWNAKK
jgi:hypothetical protein